MAEATATRPRPTRTSADDEVEEITEDTVAEAEDAEDEETAEEPVEEEPVKKPAAKKAPAKKAEPVEAEAPVIETVVYTEDIETGALTPVGTIESEKNLKVDAAILAYLGQFTDIDQHDEAVDQTFYAIENNKGLTRISVSQLPREYEIEIR